MQALPPETVGWSPRRWVVLGGVLFLAHLGAIWFLEESPAPPAISSRFGPSIHWAVDSWSVQRVADLSTISDPTAFALPNPHGFSGAAWLSFTPQQYKIADSNEPPSFLDLTAKHLGETFAHSMATNPFPPLLIADKPMPQRLGFGARLIMESLVQQSEMQVVGSLAHRCPLSSQPLPSWPHTDLLSNTVVQVLVDEAGDVLSACVLDSCGLPAADQHALKQAVQTRFQAVPDAARTSGSRETLVCGQLVFQWHTVVPPTPSDQPVSGGQAANQP